MTARAKSRAGGFGEPPSGEIGSPGLFSPRATRALSLPHTPPAPTAIKTGVAAYLHTTYPRDRDWPEPGSYFNICNS